MRVLLVSDWGVPRGGAELLTAALRRRLRERGHDARLFASSLGDEPGFADYTCRGFDPATQRQTVTRAVNPYAAVALRRVLGEFDPDVVHIRMCLSQLSPLILPPLRGVAVVYHAVIHEAVCPTLHKLLPDGSLCAVRAGAACRRNGCVSAAAWPVLMTQRALLRRWRDVFTVVVANSEATRRYLLADGIGPVQVVLNGVAEQALRPALSHPPTVVFAGRLTWPKGVDVLLRAFAVTAAAVPSARLLVAGDGPELERLERLAAQLGLGGAVTMLGHVSREALEERFAAAWVQAVPSRYEEPFGLVAAEAMMRGTAVVASRAGGLAEIVEHDGTGLLVARDDARALSAALTALLCDRERAERLGRAGRARALQALTLDSFTDQMVATYDRARAAHEARV